MNGEPETLGALGSSSGATSLNCVPCARMMPAITVYSLPEAPHLDATLDVCHRTFADQQPLARYEQAQKMQRHHADHE